MLHSVLIGRLDSIPPNRGHRQVHRWYLINLNEQIHFLNVFLVASLLGFPSGGCIHIQSSSSMNTLPGKTIGSLYQTQEESGVCGMLGGDGVCPIPLRLRRGRGNRCLGSAEGGGRETHALWGKTGFQKVHPTGEAV